MEGHTDGQMNGWMDIQMYVLMNGQLLGYHSEKKYTYVTKFEPRKDILAT